MAQNWYTYCQIEYELNSTYRKNISNPLNIESNKALKDRHSYLGNLGRYLSESVQVYGNKSGLSKKIEYYHIINKSIHIPASICYNGPLSVTSSKMVAIHALYSYQS